MQMYGNGTAHGVFLFLFLFFYVDPSSGTVAIPWLVFSGAATCTYIIVITFWVPSVRWQKYAPHLPMLYVKHKAIL